MNAQTPDFLLPYMQYGTVATLAALLFGLSRSLKIAQWPLRNRIWTVCSAVALLAVFYAAALVPARLEWYYGTQIPTIQYGILAPIAIVILLFLWWRPFRRVVEAVPQQWFVGLQLYRTLGLIFLLLYAVGRLPVEFAMPAGIGDVLIGLFAPLVAIAYKRKWRYADKLLRLWNLLGLADLVVAMTMGFLTSPSPIQQFALNDPNELIAQYPLVMVPIFLVPLAILLHLASLQRLRKIESLQPSGRGLWVEPTL